MDCFLRIAALAAAVASVGLGCTRYEHQNFYGMDYLDADTVLCSDIGLADDSLLQDMYPMYVDYSGLFSVNDYTKALGRHAVLGNDVAGEVAFNRDTLHSSWYRFVSAGDDSLFEYRIPRTSVGVEFMGGGGYGIYRCSDGWESLSNAAALRHQLRVNKGCGAVPAMWSEAIPSAWDPYSHVLGSYVVRFNKDLAPVSCHLNGMGLPVYVVSKGVSTACSDEVVELYLQHNPEVARQYEVYMPDVPACDVGSEAPLLRKKAVQKPHGTCLCDRTCSCHMYNCSDCTTGVCGQVSGSCGCVDMNPFGHSLKEVFEGAFRQYGL